MPDSMGSVFAYLPSFKGITSAIPSVETITGGDAGPDLQLGPARF
jgi:hypothetical protein